MANWILIFGLSHFLAGAGLDLAHNAQNAGVETTEDEQNSVRDVLEHCVLVFREEQRARPVNLLLHRPLNSSILKAMRRGSPATY